MSRLRTPEIPKHVAFRRPIQPWPGLPSSLTLNFDEVGQAQVLYLSFPDENGEPGKCRTALYELTAVPYPGAITRDTDGGYAVNLSLQADYLSRPEKKPRGLRHAALALYFLSHYHLRRRRRKAVEVADGD